MPVVWEGEGGVGAETDTGGEAGVETGGGEAGVETDTKGVGVGTAGGREANQERRADQGAKTGRRRLQAKK